MTPTLTPDQIPVYCFASPEQRTYEVVREAYDYWWRVHNREHGHLTCRDQYAASGFTLADVIGMQFINLHTCNVWTAKTIRVNRFGNWELLASGDYDMTRGIWWNNRFILDNDLRWDCLTLEEQFTFMIARVEYCRLQVDRTGERYEEFKNDPMNRNTKKREWLEANLELEGAIATLEIFAAEHGLPLGTAAINIGRIGTEEKPVQLRLF